MPGYSPTGPAPAGSGQDRPPSAPGPGRCGWTPADRRLPGSVRSDPSVLRWCASVYYNGRNTSAHSRRRFSGDLAGSSVPYSHRSNSVRLLIFLPAGHCIRRYAEAPRRRGICPFSPYPSSDAAAGPASLLHAPGSCRPHGAGPPISDGSGSRRSFRHSRFPEVRKWRGNCGREDPRTCEAERKQIPWERRRLHQSSPDPPRKRSPAVSHR